MSGAGCVRALRGPGPPVPPRPGAGQLWWGAVGQPRPWASGTPGSGRGGGRAGMWARGRAPHPGARGELEAGPAGALLGQGLPALRGGRGVLGCGPGGDRQAHQCPHSPDRLWVLGKKFRAIHRRGRKPYPWSVLPHLELGSIRKIKINMIFL